MSDVPSPVPRLPVVVAARRTPFVAAGHGLRRVDAAGLAAPVLSALVGDLRQAGVHGPDDHEGGLVDDVVLGNCVGPGGDPARSAALLAGLGVHTSAVTVDRQCGSGQEAVHVAAAAVASGAADVVLAGGVESPSTAPWRLHRPASGTAVPRLYERAPFAPAPFDDPEMGPAADELAARAGVSRERQDAYACRSHERASASARAGEFDAELVPVGGVGCDPHLRPRSRATLARLRPAFGVDGTVTAGSCGAVADGAAGVAVVSDEVRARAGLPGLVVRGWCAAGVDPALPGLGPVPAIQRLVRRAGVSLDEVGAIEIAEAFAAQVLAGTDALGLDPLGADDTRVATQGGAIAFGHPWGASGAALLVRLFARMVRADGPRLGLAACAVGGGQGVAVLVERVGP